jgi:hypothetical protein
VSLLDPLHASFANTEVLRAALVPLGAHSQRCPETTHIRFKYGVS